MWEEVSVCEEVGPLVKGSLRTTDMVVWHVGMGMDLYGVKALRLSYNQPKRVPLLQAGLTQTSLMFNSGCTGTRNGCVLW
jgi:hypothetical protein